MTIEYDAKLAATARETFTRYGFQDRVTVVEGRAEEAYDSSKSGNECC